MLGYRANLHVTVAAQKMQTPVITSTGPNQSHSLAAKSTRTRMQSGQLRGAPSTVHTPLPDPAWPPDAPRWGVVLLLHQGWRFLPKLRSLDFAGAKRHCFRGEINRKRSQRIVFEITPKTTFALLQRHFARLLPVHCHSPPLQSSQTQQCQTPTLLHDV